MSGLPEDEKQNSGKAPGKMKFSRTCSLLSQYMKERRRIKGKMEAKETPGTVVTMDLLAKVDKPAESSAQASPSAAAPPPTIHSRNNAAMVSGGPQMTIFYGGQVLVFDKVPTDKAQEIVAFATKRSSSTSSTQTAAVSDSKYGSHSSQEFPCPKPDIPASDLPIARRASLHRFLEKRKDRVASTAPYQAIHPPMAAPNSQEGTSSQDTKGECSKELELRL